MIKFFTTLLLIIGLSACGGGNSDSNPSGAGEVIKESGTKTDVSQPGPFKEGEFGEIRLSADYAAVQKDLKDAVLIDIRTAWEREKYGYPKGFDANIAYQNRDYNEAGRYTTKPLNPEFVQKVTELVNGDLHKKIILICDSSSRSGAHSNKAKDSAAKLLSEKGFTNVYHIFGGFRGNEAGDYENGWIKYHLPVEKITQQLAH